MADLNLQRGEARMHLGCGNGSGEGRGSVVSASIEDREGEVSGISVVADMHEAQRRSALEDESARAGHPCLGQLRHDVREDIVALGNMSVEPVRVS